MFFFALSKKIIKFAQILTNFLNLFRVHFKLSRRVFGKTKSEAKRKPEKLRHWYLRLARNQATI